MPNKSMTWGAVTTSLDISELNNLGICVSQDNEILYNEQFDYYVIKFYANYGTGQVSVDTSNFHITKGYPLNVTTNQHGYLSQNQSGVNIQRGMSGPLITYGGEHILYNPDATYTINTIDNTSHQSIDTTYFSIIEYNGNVGLHLSDNSPVQVYNNVQRVDFSVTTQSRVGDEVTITADLPYTTSVTSYKLRLADKYPDAVWLYFTPDKSEELIIEDTPMPLYKSDGALATRTDYGDYELEALEPIPPYANNDGYGRFSNAVFSYNTYSSTSDVLHVSFSDLYQGSEDGACITDRLRVNIAIPTAQTAQLGGVITSTTDSVISVPVEQICGSAPFYGYAYSDGALLDMTWNFGGVVEEYSPAPALPTVSKQIWGTFYNRIQDHYKTVSADAVARVYNSSQAFDPFLYDANLVYAIKRLYYRHGDTSGVEMPMMNDSGCLAAHNTTGNEIQVSGCYFVTCSSSDATVITVYDSSNNTYNAFKYTSDGTDYYYVLDGTQTDWTDDLASIGYKLIAVFSGYVQADKSSIPIVGNSYYQLYDENGNSIYKQSGKTYYYERAVGPNGETVNISARSPFEDFTGGVLVWSPLQSSPGSVLVHKVEYTIE